MNEIWDLYDKNKNKLNKTVKRGDKLKFGEYHLVVNIWIKNDQNEFLITQRSINKSHPLMWECTGGSAIKGETSIDAAIREVKEELGITLNKDNATFIGNTTRYYPNCPDILDVWLFKTNISIKEIKIQKEEVNDVMWATKENIIKLYDEGKFEANAYIENVINS